MQQRYDRYLFFLYLNYRINQCFDKTKKGVLRNKIHANRKINTNNRKIVTYIIILLL